MRTTTWHNIGHDVENCNNMEQVLKSSGLDYEVVKEPVFLEMNNGIVVPNRFATVNSNGRIYDVVSDKFEVVQNRDAFDFVNYMGADLTFEKAGETSNGMVYIIGKLPGMNILGDEFTPYVIFRNGFSGKYKITASICPLRIVCQNQFNVSFKETNNTVTVRHTSNANAKLQEAREVLKASANFMEELNRHAQMYANMKFSPEMLGRVLDRLFPIDGIEEMNAFKRNRLVTAREAFEKAYNHEDNQNFKGTAWGIINAYTDFVTHREATGKVNTRDESKFTKVTFGVPSVNQIADIIKIVA
jgi:phage/plasmid-like protein (TIGR03299 family)